MDRLEKEHFLQLLEEKDNSIKYNKINTIFPDSGPYSRDKYPKHISFLNATAKYKEVALVAGNRTGKTLTLDCLITYTLLGEYPSFYEGKKFNCPTIVWACGTTTKTVRDILQFSLLGPRNDLGSGLIPKDKIIGQPLSKPGVPDGIECVKIRHISGGESILYFKSYDSGVDSFTGTSIHLVALDEEPPENIHTECLIRTTTTKGIVACTFTPIHGFSNVVLSFLPGGRIEDLSTKFVEMIELDEVPHLDEEQKREMIASMPTHERDARTKGIPSLGVGKIYTVSEAEFVIPPFKLPDFWPRVFGLDLGFAHPTAAVWGAWDRDTDIIYIYDEYRSMQELPSTHASNLISRGSWIPGIIDNSANTVSITDGRRLYDIYEKFGLSLTPVTKGAGSVDIGLHAVQDRLESGRLKVFSKCQNWIGEYRLYRRNDMGRIVKNKDDLMDATRYLVVQGIYLASVNPGFDVKHFLKEEYRSGMNPVTGY